MKYLFTKYVELGPSINFLNEARYYLKQAMLTCLTSIGIPLLIVACSEGRTETTSVEKTIYKERIHEVDVLILEKTVFYKEIVSNGKLKAHRKSDLRFKVPGELKELKVKNGDLIRKGQIIAVLEQFQYHQALEQAETNFKRTSIELEDALIAHGGSLQGKKIPPEILENAEISSGYVAAANNVKTAEFNLRQTVLRAPFSGKIANLKQREFEMIYSAEPFCTLIDDSVFEVEFYLIESEIQDVALNDNVKIQPFSANHVLKGSIWEINPLVDENGLVLVKAMVHNTAGLWEGMNVKVLIEKEKPGHLIIPKSAVVLRQNQEVLFKYVNGGAHWTYVRTDLENGSSYSVTSDADKGGDIEAGDTVITTNNINLAHGSKVRIKTVHGRDSI